MANLRKKPWGRESSELPRYVVNNLYQVYHLLGKDTRIRVGLMMEIPVFIKDPLVALENPLVGVQEIEVRLEIGMGDGPTSSRVTVVDFNFDTQNLIEPVVWDEGVGWFRNPPLEAPPIGAGEQALGELLPDVPPKTSKKVEVYREFIEKTVRNPYFHQLNVWAVVQRVLEFYEEPWALGRPVPWGFDGNRLIVVPHAGYGENAYYDRHSKSLQFYYFGDRENPGFTCLSHDVIAHETGQAILDGIRPMYSQLSSIQTAAFPEFVGDLTAILLALFNEDIRQFVAKTTEGRQEEANIMANIAPRFGQEVEGRPYLRTAFNQLTLQDIQNSMSPRSVSQVMTGAMFDILTEIVTRDLENYYQKEDREEGEERAVARGDIVASRDLIVDQVGPTREVTLAQALWWAAKRFSRIALQPLDLCPPCDVQFIDYAKAVIRNDILTDPVDALGYRQIMLDVFHRRGLCTCGYEGYESGKNLPEDCQFQEALQVERLDFVFLDTDRLSRSRTTASYFVNDNLDLLHIPLDKNFRVVDLYDINKYGADGEMLPSEVVLEYAWQEEIDLANDLQKNLAFGKWNGKKFKLNCGGTLVFDVRGNLLSWFRKPGIEHTADAKEGLRRKTNLLNYLSALIQRGLIDTEPAGPGFSGVLRPIIAFEEGDVVRFELSPQFRKSDLDMDQEGWLFNY